MAKLVGIIMGSDSDLPIMAEAAKVLDQFGVEYEVKISSAHRAPEVTIEWAKGAVERGLEVIIAGAGVAAHLPGVVAAVTPLPVIGVPIKAGALNGIDALYAIVQMPSGIPVATVAINGAKNAGLLAVQILASTRPELQAKLVEYRRKLAEEVQAKADKLQQLGIDGYLAQKQQG
ncbi:MULTISPECIES: 5-(carboxyamino)imidazole ribonucleotide mutase [Carboxydocella]|uniref:N5-carboxyaminoimidazole ribonucleotide mutase n=2 Tax=Carboxydocella TaxID=178898 RepID=A0A1T4QA78_9FIRM|nr:MULTISPECIES: 5-(carboxyamino)imidazole ribonucleotide mutase [Carboxydocella]AVX19357.1 5-(carboxyamino)imidazole ribonucleotide mutase [Carboxydocella thermautotrophica]AVX29771.1 5-(carboxyamino)imidazole ribonucleotide mutase [Carboxydocella thermautotrophica]SKA00547.1 5-(carboxyamino)imidazole ribonucleotide mutase [Carboxydocella sporoproducens DSM 16521]GAW29157.1 5-(carboxyamino)imidazole ribonucleotide mutase [Carboxydocella sp. ULO1]GAW32782.1 5-(carboxyamino)imidazole ribonucleo